MTNDGQHLFMCLLVLFISPLEKHLFRSFALFLIELSLFSCRSSSCILVIRVMICKYFSPYLGYLFTFSVVFFHAHRFTILSPGC